MTTTNVRLTPADLLWKLAPDELERRADTLDAEVLQLVREAGLHPGHQELSAAKIWREFEADHKRAEARLCRTIAARLRHRELLRQGDADRIAYLAGSGSSNG